VTDRQTDRQPDRHITIAITYSLGNLRYVTASIGWCLVRYVNYYGACAAAVQEMEIATAHASKVLWFVVKSKSRNEKVHYCCELKFTCFLPVKNFWKFIHWVVIFVSFFNLYFTLVIGLWMLIWLTSYRNSSMCKIKNDEVYTQGWPVSCQICRQITRSTRFARQVGLVKPNPNRKTNPNPNRRNK